MPDITADWSLSLTESVFALGAAARELRAARNSARLIAWNADPARLVPVGGLLSVTDAEAVRPHDEALWQLSDLYMVLEHHTAELYENAALGYAYGAAHAIQAVLRSEHPQHVELSRDRNGLYRLLPDGLPDLSESLSSAAGSRQLAEHRKCVQVQERARDAAEVAGRVLDSSTDLADSRYAYGEQAEKTLRYLLRFAEEHGFLRAAR